MNLPTRGQVLEQVKYDPETGVFIRSNLTARKSRIGFPTGTIKDGYVLVTVLGKQYRAHRLAWLVMTNEWPKKEIDHKNLDRSDNRWINLRPADKRQNAQNTSIRKDNISGYKGVAWDAARGKWRADITLPHVRKHLGMYEDPAIAHEAYALAVKKYFGEYGRLS